MNILAVDTSTSVLNVSVKKDEQIYEYSIETGTSQHSELLLPLILEKLKEINLELKNIDLFVCTRGPGSFTGLRIGMSCLKGLAYGLNKPLVSVSTLLVYANMSEKFDGATVVALDAKKQRYYLAAFNVQDDQITRISEDIDGNTPELSVNLDTYNDIVITGPDKEEFYKQIKEYYKDSKRVHCSSEYKKTLGNVLIKLGEQQFNEIGADDIGQGPVYIRKSDAEVALEEKLKK